MIDRSIILVSYQFCPMGGIGTRRWSKFAKYLSKSGYTIHVIGANYSITNPVNWCHDVLNDPNIIIHRIKMKYPSFLLNPKRTFWVKLMERVIKLGFFSIDFGQYSESTLEKKLKEVLKLSKAETVITTGGPYSQFYYLSVLKEKLKFKLILDYRDPWNMLLRFKGPIKNYMRRRSIFMEQFALQNADKILFTNNDLRNKYLDSFPDIRSRSATVFNGFDNEDYSGIVSVDPSNDGYFNIIYLGSVTVGRAEAFKLIFDTLIKYADLTEFKKIRLHIYAPHIQSILQLGDQYSALITKQLVHHEPLNPANAMQKLYESDACLSINEKRFPYLIGAKTYDYMALAKPILHISEGGELSEILTSSGQFITNYQIENCKIALQHLMQHKPEFKPGQYGDFELKHLTQTLIKEIENV